MTRTTKQILADQERQAEADRISACAQPIPESLAWQHAKHAQHRRWGWHDMRTGCVINQKGRCVKPGCDHEPRGVPAERNDE